MLFEWYSPDIYLAVSNDMILDDSNYWPLLLFKMNDEEVCLKDILPMSMTVCGMAASR